jgi:hypothetical protein
LCSLLDSSIWEAKTYVCPCCSIGMFWIVMSLAQLLYLGKLLLPLPVAHPRKLRTRDKKWLAWCQIANCKDRARRSFECPCCHHIMWQKEYYQREEQPMLLNRELV